MKAYNLKSPQGNTIPNQIVVELNGIEYFFSYGELAAVYCEDKVYLIEGVYNYSRTTKKYVNIFLKDKSVKEQIIISEFKDCSQRR